MILYRCISKNSLGETDGHIMLYKLEVETEEDEAEEEEEDDDVIEEEEEETNDESERYTFGTSN